MERYTKVFFEKNGTDIWNVRCYLVESKQWRDWDRVSLLEISQDDNFTILATAEVQVAKEEWLPQEFREYHMNVKDYLQETYNSNEYKSLDGYLYLEDLLRNAKLEEKELSLPVAGLHNITVNKEERGNGFGTLLMEGILTFLGQLQVKIVLLQAQPLQDHKEDEKPSQTDLEKLIRFYQKLDFKEIENESITKSRYMIKSL